MKDLSFKQTTALLILFGVIATVLMSATVYYGFSEPIEKATKEHIEIHISNATCQAILVKELGAFSTEAIIYQSQNCSEVIEFALNYNAED